MILIIQNIPYKLVEVFSDRFEIQHRLTRLSDKESTLKLLPIPHISIKSEPLCDYVIYESIKIGGKFYKAERMGDGVVNSLTITI